jgi:hypothetical protein
MMDITKLLNKLSDTAVKLGGSSYSTNLPNVSASSNQLNSILNIVFSIIGALSVLFVVIGGLRYVLSDGDPKKTSEAKQTIIYAVIGLVIAALAEIIVAFVLTQAGGG